MMEPIRTKVELLDNIKLVDQYLKNGTSTEKRQMHDLIRLGYSFVVYERNGEYRFVPSRYIGYVNNTIAKHKNHNKRKDGGETNRHIPQVLMEKRMPSEELDKIYISYCLSLGVEPKKLNKRKRFFWVSLIDTELRNEEDQEILAKKGYSEGRIKKVIHERRERNRIVVKNAKDIFRKQHGRLYCQVCKFDKKANWDDLSDKVIEAHHINPVKDMPEDHETFPEDFAMLCPTCHRMVHAARPEWLTMEQLEKIRGVK